MAKARKDNPRTSTLSAKVTPMFQEEIKAKAEELGLTQSDYIYGLLSAALDNRLEPKHIDPSNWV